jgi:hypothetical protein
MADGLNSELRYFGRVPVGGPLAFDFLRNLVRGRRRLLRRGPPFSVGGASRSNADGMEPAADLTALQTAYPNFKHLNVSHAAVRMP